MKIINLGLDNSVLDKNSSLAKRIIEYGSLIEKYIIIVPAKRDIVLTLSDKSLAYGAKIKNKIFGLIKIYFLAKKLIEKGKVDVITVQGQYYLAILGWWLAKKFKIGLEIQVHGFEKYKGLRKLLAKFIIPRANAVRCVSQRLKKQLIEEFRVKEEKITVVPIFSELRIMNHELKMDKKNNNFIFLTVGRLVPVKNINMQIEAMAEVVKKYPKTELWIAGDGPERDNYQLQIANYKLHNNIKLLGWQNNLEKFYSQADAFLLTSNYEGWGLVVIEAASFGLPIIMTDVGCAGEIIKDGENGIVIPVGDRERLEEATIELIENESLRIKLGKDAKNVILNLPTREDTLKLYKESWQKAIRL